jgi:hypothetical protein
LDSVKAAERAAKWECLTAVGKEKMKGMRMAET